MRTLPVFHWKRTFAGHVSVTRAADGSGSYECAMFAAGGKWHLRIRFIDKAKHETVLHSSDYPKANVCSAAAFQRLSEVIETREAS